ncbi:Tight junction protein ZO-3 [Toxocara canis]|uniref:Tight junction protein ZO-3 n=1 Tax=Toxocara canis TaxID=6265 RepID=A0A0B2VHW5_TOXCA|nr:Tight junction protein ZO-3 [Toxocara canis]
MLRRKSENYSGHSMIIHVNGILDLLCCCMEDKEVPTVGFGIAVSGGLDNPHFTSGDPAVVVSDVVPSGPAWGLVQVNDRILSANGVSLENAEYASAIRIMKESQQLNMIIKRRAPIPFIEFEQRTLKFTLSKSHKKEGGLRHVAASFRWPSQTTVYERLGSLSATPRHSPSPMLSAHQPLGKRSSNDYVNNSAYNVRWPQADQQSLDYGEYYRRNGSLSSGQGQASNSVRVAVRHLLSLSDDVKIKVEYAPTEFEQIRNGQLGDDFYIRTHFANQKVTNQLELTFHNADIFHITDTLFGGTVGLWQATRVYSSAENGNGSLRQSNKGVIPNAETAKELMKAARAADASTLGRSTFFRRKLKERRTKSLTKNAIDDIAFSEPNCDVPLPAYERVVLTHPPFPRPVVLYGPLADVARQMLLANFALRFASARDESIVRLSSIDAVIAANKHCVLDVSPGSVERLHLVQYAPIVILIDVESRARIRELRAKAGAPSVSSRKLIEQMHKIKKHYSHLLTATLDATKEDGWFEALRQLIAHLQDRRVWMPEFRLSSNPSDVILLPMQSFQNQSDSDVDSLKGDYSTTDYATKMQLLGDGDVTTLRSIYEPPDSNYGGHHVPRTLQAAQSQPHASFVGGATCENSSYYQNVHQQLPKNSITPPPSSSSHGYYDVKQILAEQLSDYCGHRESTGMPLSQQYQNTHDFRYAGQVQSFAQGTAQEGQAGFRSGLFYDHVTRGRWGGGSCNERNLGFTPVQGQPAHSVRRSPLATSSPVHTESAMNNSPVRYADESPKSQPEYGEMSSENASDARPKSKVATPNDFIGTQTNVTDSNSPVGSVDSADEKREATVIEHVSQVVDSNGCTLSCPESGVMLIIPKGAIGEGVQQEIYVKVCRANSGGSRPPLDESRGECLMSPLVMCGPHDLHFNVPVELRLPHSASSNGENWSFALKSGTGEQWNQIALDGNNSSLVTDKFASIKICHF